MGRKKKDHINIDQITVEQKVDIDYERMQGAIVQGVLKAQEIGQERKQQQLEDERKALLKERRKNLKIANAFDDEGKPLKKAAKFRLFWNFLWAKDDALKDIDVLREVVNSVVALFFGFIQWCLYVAAVILICLFGISLYSYIQADEQEILNLITTILYLPYALLSFILAKTLIRVMKIECKYNKDANYMLNFLAVIIAIIALLASILGKN